MTASPAADWGAGQRNDCRPGPGVFLAVTPRAQLTERRLRIGSHIGQQALRGDHVELATHRIPLQHRNVLVLQAPRHYLHWLKIAARGPAYHTGTEARR